MMIPLTVFSSAAAGLTSTLSANGLMFILLKLMLLFYFLWIKLTSAQQRNLCQKFVLTERDQKKQFAGRL
jgi:hypothetical protein